MINFKKIATVLGSTLMVGSTMAMAAAANYPGPFVQGGNANVAIVYGDAAASSDIVAASNINTDLASALAGQTGTGAATSTVTTSGDVVSLDTSSTRIWLNTSNNVAKSTLTKTHLPVVLADYTFNGNVESKLTSTITVGAGDTAGGENSGKVWFGKQPKSSNDPVIGLSIGDKGAALYNATFTSPAINFSHSDSEGESIRLFGRDFVISPATDADTLVLFSSAEEVTLTKVGASNPSSTITISGEEHTIELLNGDGTSATIAVDGSSSSINEGSSRKISGVDIALIDSISSDAGGITARLLVGAEKITFEDGTQVTTGSDNSPVDGTLVFLTGSGGAGSVDDLTELKIQVYRPDTNTDSLLPGEDFDDPVFGSFKVSFAGLSSPLDDASRETITIENGGDKIMELALTDSSGNAESFEFAYNSSGVFNLTDGGGYQINVREMATVNENEYIVFSISFTNFLIEASTCFTGNVGCFKIGCGNS